MTCGGWEIFLKILATRPSWLLLFKKSGYW